MITAFFIWFAIGLIISFLHLGRSHISGWSRKRMIFNIKRITLKDTTTLLWMTLLWPLVVRGDCH